MPAYQIGIKLSTTDSDGKAFTSAPTYVQMTSATNMIDVSRGIVQALMLLENAGVIDSYDVVLKCETNQAAPGAGP
jgi:hypothetical protein